MAEPVLLRAQSTEDADDFVDLLLMSAPEFFPALYGKTFDKVHRDLFSRPLNAFSYEHVEIAKVSGQTAGMVLGYDWAAGRNEHDNTGKLIISQMGTETLSSRLEDMLWVDAVLLKMDEGAFYISNMAVYPQFRRLGLATMMLSHCEELARKAGNTKIVLDVEPSHEPAKQLYRNFGMKMVGELKRRRIDGQDFKFLRMEKGV